VCSAQPDHPGPDLAELTSRAVSAARSAPAVGADQWVYRRIVVVPTPERAGDPYTFERWTTGDHATAAAYVDGRLEVGPWAWRTDPRLPPVRVPIRQPALPYGELGDLPDQPDALVSLLARTPVPRDEEYHAGHAFELIAELFLDYAVPPGPAARLYRALGSIALVRPDHGAVDVTGRRLVGFWLSAVGGNQEILLDPVTYRFRGYQFFGDGLDIHAGNAWGTAILDQVSVPAPGARPPGLT
jgi:hypothetical protein